MKRTINIIIRWWGNLLLPFTIFLAIVVHCSHGQQQDPSTLNGGSILAMTGDGCVAVVVDKRYGSGSQMINVSPRTVLLPSPTVIVGFTGLGGDVLTVADELSEQLSSRMDRTLGGVGFVGGEVLREGGGAQPYGSVGPNLVSSLLSHMLYSRRGYFVEPVIAGLDVVTTFEDNGEETGPGDVVLNGEKSKCVRYVPYLCAQDMIGARSQSSSFVCSGAASNSLYGIAEAMWRPGLKPEELVSVCGRAFLSALERDCLSGYGATLYIIVGGKGIIEYDLACRND